MSNAEKNMIAQNVSNAIQKSLHVFATNTSIQCAQKINLNISLGCKIAE